MSDLPPRLYRLYRQNLRRNTTVKEYRQMHKLERVMYFWPMWAWVYMRGRRLKPKPTQPPAGGFLIPKTRRNNRGR